MTIAPRRMLGNIRAAAGAGRWLCIVEAGRTITASALRRQGSLGLADDLARADGEGNLSFATALGLAARWQPPDAPPGGKITVRRAFESYVAAKRAADGEAAAEGARGRLWLHVLRELGLRVASLDPELEALEAGEYDEEAGTLRQSRAMKEKYLALKAKADHETQISNLVSIEGIRYAMTDLDTARREATKDVPDRLAPLTAPITDAEEVHALIDQAMRELLITVSESVARPEMKFPVQL